MIHQSISGDANLVIKLLFVWTHEGPKLCSKSSVVNICPHSLIASCVTRVVNAKSLWEHEASRLCFKPQFKENELPRYIAYVKS
jgi:hypothetical protein